MAAASMFNDMGSEMIIPMIPAIILYLFNGPAIAVSLFLGLSQFLAKATSIYFGNKSDEEGKRKKFIVGGYSLSAIMKAMLTTAASWVSFMGYYLVERLGKGMRESPRDALLAESEPEKNRGAAFGLRKFFDNTGAIIGPLIVLSLFTYMPNTSQPDLLKLIILIAVFPTAVSALITLFLKDSNKSSSKKRARKVTPIRAKNGLFETIKSLLSGENKQIYIGLFLLALAQFDIGIYIMFAQEHIDLVYIPLIYIAYTAVYTLATMPLGILTDIFGGKKVLSYVIILFSISVLIISIAPNIYSFLLFMAVFGIFMAGKRVSTPVLLTIGEHSSKYGKKIGMFKTLDGVGMLISNSIAGVLWGFSILSAPIVFPLSIILALASAFVIYKI